VPEGFPNGEDFGTRGGGEMVDGYGFCAGVSEGMDVGDGAGAGVVGDGTGGAVGPDGEGAGRDGLVGDGFGECSCGRAVLDVDSIGVGVEGFLTVFWGV
jgi:hypothetical protein